MPLPTPETCPHRIYVKPEPASAPSARNCVRNCSGSVDDGKVFQETTSPSQARHSDSQHPTSGSVRNRPTLARRNEQCVQPPSTSFSRMLSPFPVPTTVISSRARHHGCPRTTHQRPLFKPLNSRVCKILANRRSWRQRNSSIFSNNCATEERNVAACP